jgi:hypothetical protein
MIYKIARCKKADSLTGEQVEAYELLRIAAKDAVTYGNYNYKSKQYCALKLALERLEAAK